MMTAASSLFVLLFVTVRHAHAYNLPTASMRSASSASTTPAILMQVGPSGLGKPAEGPQRKPKPLPENKSRSAEMLEEAKKEEEVEFDAALLAAAELARSPGALDAQREAGKQAAAAIKTLLEADDGSALAKVIASKGKTKPTGKLAKALKKPKGTMAVIGEGCLLQKTSLGGFDLNDAEYTSKEFRDGGAVSVSVKMTMETALSSDALAVTVAEQATAKGEFPSPLPAIVRGPLIDPLQLAEAAAGGAVGAVVPLALNGVDGTAALLEEASQLGLEAIVRVCTAEELESALTLEPSMLLIGDCTVQQAGELVEATPAKVITIADVPFLDVRGAWRLRDLQFNALLAGKSMLEVCIRDRVPPSAALKAILSKGSVKYGLGMQKGARARTRTHALARVFLCPCPASHRACSRRLAATLTTTHLGGGARRRSSGGIKRVPRLALHVIWRDWWTVASGEQAHVREAAGVATHAHGMHTIGTGARA